MGDINDEGVVSEPGARARLSINCKVMSMQNIE